MGMLRLHDSVKSDHLSWVDPDGLEQSQPLTVGFIFMKAAVA